MDKILSGEAVAPFMDILSCAKETSPTPVSVYRVGLGASPVPWVCSIISKVE